jgi:hypothetical protein
LFAVINLAAVSDFVGALLRHGPSWELVPSLVLSLAALVGALRSFLDGAQSRRFAADEHRLKVGILECLPRRPPGSEKLN